MSESSVEEETKGMWKIPDSGESNLERETGSKRKTPDSDELNLERETVQKKENGKWNTYWNIDRAE